jgi:hypothetical protein
MVRSASILRFAISFAATAVVFFRGRYGAVDAGHRESPPVTSSLVRGLSALPLLKH